MDKKIFRGDIWEATLIGKGSMQKGFRPVVIMSNNVGNKHSPTITVIPLTTQHKPKLPTHTTVHGVGMDKVSTALAECVITIDKSMLKEKKGYVIPYEMEKINYALAIQTGLVDLLPLTSNM